MKKFDIQEFEKLDNYEVADYMHDHDFHLTKEKRQISQAQRNAVREKLIEMAAESFKDEYGIDGVQTSDGYMLEIQSYQLGAVIVEVALKIKNLDYNIYDAINDYETRQK